MLRGDDEGVIARKMVKDSQPVSTSSQSLFSDQAEEVFCAAVEILDLSKRQNFVEEACAGNAGLRARVEALLFTQKEVGEFFEDAASVLSFAAKAIADGGLRTSGIEEAVCFDEPGTQIGHYKLLQLLGEGGCGIVYLAEQTEPVHRQVALKIIKLGMDTKGVITRFRAEQQALAMMDHPNIARVLDAGATAAGRPYFVMELVRGVKITTYCNERQVAMPERLRIFIQICHAIQHAHQKGIIHRDIKPSNILVTSHDGEAAPMVIDFGIAKAMQGRLAGQTIFTRCDQFIGTPAYLSPEQADSRRVDADTRSDIYSLGVLLYELLTGRTPFHADQLLQSGIDEMRRTLREREPPRPSSIVRGLKGDLDWIVMKALEKDRNRRYQTANAMATDVQCYLDNEAIAARPPSQLYQFQKFMHRNKVVFASGAAVVAALALGLVASLCLLYRVRVAEREQARLRGIAEKGLATEAELRQKAERGEKIARAIMLLNGGAYDEAEEIAARLPLQDCTMQGAEVFRCLGDWNATQKRWTAAKSRFYQLVHATRNDDPLNTSTHALRLALCVVESGNWQEYETVCQESLKAFGGTKSPVVAERAIKQCLLRPLSQPLRGAVAPLAELLRSSLAAIDFSFPQTGWPTPWLCMTLALWEYRVDAPSEAMVWCERCLRSGESPWSRSSTARVILAMSLQRLNKTTEAHAELERARAVIESNNQLEVNDGDGANWFDEAISGILLAEGMELIEPIGVH